jgi:hypothetical protein
MTEMTIKTADLLDLLTYAGELDLSIFAKKDKGGDYVVKFYEPYTNGFDETLFISNERWSEEWYAVGKGTCCLQHLMDTFVDMLKKKEKLKSQKRQEVLNKLTNEELELLGVVK